MNKEFEEKKEDISLINDLYFKNIYTKDKRNTKLRAQDIIQQERTYFILLESISLMGNLIDDKILQRVSNVCNTDVIYLKKVIISPTIIDLLIQNFTEIRLFDSIITLQQIEELLRDDQISHLTFQNTTIKIIPNTTYDFTQVRSLHHLKLYNVNMNNVVLQELCNIKSIKRLHMDAKQKPIDLTLIAKLIDIEYITIINADYYVNVQALQKNNKLKHTLLTTYPSKLTSFSLDSAFKALCRKQSQTLNMYLNNHRNYFTHTLGKILTTETINITRTTQYFYFKKEYTYQHIQAIDKVIKSVSANNHSVSEGSAFLQLKSDTQQYIKLHKKHNDNVITALENKIDNISHNNFKGLLNGILVLVKYVEQERYFLSKNVVCEIKQYIESEKYTDRKRALYMKIQELEENHSFTILSLDSIKLNLAKLVNYCLILPIVESQVAEYLFNDLNQQFDKYIINEQYGIIENEIVAIIKCIQQAEQKINQYPKHKMEEIEAYAINETRSKLMRCE